MSITLRNIQNDDLKKIMDWRMSPDITKFMNTDPKLTLEGQKKWLSEIKKNDSVRYWLIEIDKQPAGVINLTELDNPNGTIGWGYYVGEKKLRSYKNALSLEMSMYDYAFDVLDKKRVYANVLSINTGVIALHEICGCETIKVLKNHIQKNGIPYDVTLMEMTSEKWNTLRHNNSKYEKINFDIPKD